MWGKHVRWLPPQLHPLEEVDEQAMFGLSAGLGGWIYSKRTHKDFWMQVFCKGFGCLC